METEKMTIEEALNSAKSALSHILVPVELHSLIAVPIGSVIGLINDIQASIKQPKETE